MLHWLRPGANTVDQYPFETNAPGLKVLVQEAHQQDRKCILDLSPAVGANVEFFSRWHCKLYFEDLFGAMQGNEMQNASESELDRYFSELLVFESGLIFDIVLCWDRLNYLNRRQLKSFVKSLLRYTDHGTQLHALICSLQHMPRMATKYWIKDEAHLGYQLENDEVKESPRFYQTELKALMSSFSIFKAVLLQNGSQEYVFRREATALGTPHN